MGSFSIWHILILGAAALLLFGGRGKISDFMGDFGKGIRSFKRGLVEEDADSASQASVVTDRPVVERSTAPLAAPMPVRAGEG